MEKRTRIKPMANRLGSAVERVWGEDGRPEYFAVLFNDKTAGLPENVGSFSLSGMVEDIISQLRTFTLGLLDAENDDQIYEYEKFARLARRQPNEIFDLVDRQIGEIEIVYRDFNGELVDAYIAQKNGKA